MVPSHIGATPIHTIPFLFPPSGVVSAPVMATLSLPGLTLGLPVWYLSPPVRPPTPDVVLQPVQPIITTSQPHPGVATLSSSMKPPPPLTKPTRGRGPQPYTAVPPPKTVKNPLCFVLLPNACCAMSWAMRITYVLSYHHYRNTCNCLMMTPLSPLSI